MTPKTATNAAAEAERLAAEAAEAIAKAEAARQRAQEAAQRAEERRHAAVLEIRRTRLATYDEAALQAEEREARAAFEKAVLADEGAVAAFTAWQVAASRRYLLAVDARQAQQILEPGVSGLAVGGPPGHRYVDEVQRVIDRAVANRVEDLREEMQTELDAAAR